MRSPSKVKMLENDKMKVEGEKSKRKLENHQNSEEKVPKNKKPKKSFLYGNYDNYYYKRNGPSAGDIRVQMLLDYSSYIENKKVLDIGCNSGIFTFEMAKQFHPISTLGIDIDEHLIDKARSMLDELKKNSNNSEADELALNHITFRKSNYILKNQDLIAHERPFYDVIFCLSVTKWIHLNHGDDGIKFLFKRIYKQLNENGILILEAQAFDTYKKRSKLSQEIHENYINIKLKPMDFESYLLSNEIGFKEVKCIVDKSELDDKISAQGFRRSLHMFIKS